MCGIFAWAGKKASDFDKHKLDILGMYNIERGKHSCGISIDGDIFIGVDSNKVYHDFLANSNYDAPKKFPLAIGHTRHATGGAHNLENAHPFGFGKVGDSYNFIGVHNGKLHNEIELADTFNVEKTERIEDKNHLRHRSKIDSEILLEAIFNNKDFKVLEAYDGAAALVFCNIKKPNEVYFYHGASKKTDVDKEPTEERPLFFWQENENSVYVSSLAKSLYAIGGRLDNVRAFAYNTVYKVTDGNVAKATKFKINRDAKTQSKVYGQTKSVTTTTHSHTNHGSGCRVNDYRSSAGYIAQRAAARKANDGVIQFPSESPSADVNIYLDEPNADQNEYGGKIFMKQLRYFRNGHPIKGIYAWIPKFNSFYFLSDRPKDAEQRFYDVVNKYFYKNDFIGNITNLTTAEKKELFIPFLSTAEEEIVFPQLYYFYDGIRVKTKTDYEACINPAVHFSWDALSLCAAHPICDTGYKFKSHEKQGIIQDSKLVTDTVSPLGSNKIYTIVDGNCVKIQSQFEVDAESITKISDAVSKIMTIEKDVLVKEVNEPSVDDEDLLDKDLDYFFKESLSKFPNYIKRLKQYKSHRAQDAKIILELFVEDATKLMTIDIND